MLRSTIKKKTIRDIWNGKDDESDMIEKLMRDQLTIEELEVVVWLLAREYETFKVTKWGRPYANVVKGIYDVLNNYLPKKEEPEEVMEDEPDTSPFE